MKPAVCTPKSLHLPLNHLRCRSQSLRNSGQTPLGPSQGKSGFCAMPFSPTGSLPNHEMWTLMWQEAPCFCRAGLINSTALFTKCLRVFLHIISWTHSVTYSGNAIVEVFGKVLLFECTTLACDQRTAGVGDKNPDDGRARL